MAVTSRNLHRQPTRMLNTSRPMPTQVQQQWANLPQHMLTILMLTLVLGAMWMLLQKGQVWFDDIRYGNPRTTHLRALVGHEETQGQPTDFIAMNLDQRVVVLTLPGGDTTKAKILNGPYLFGSREELTPISMRVEDRNGDGSNDLVINIKNEEVIYVNTGDSFRLLTSAERQQLVGVQP